MLIFYIYIFIVFLCLIFSIINKYSRQRFLYLYFLTVFVSELLVYFQILDSSIYNYTKIFYILFFIHFFKDLFKIKRNIIICLSIVIICCSLKNIIGNDSILPILQSMIYLFICLEWMRLQIKTPDEITIYNKQSFWLCIALLLWSNIFLMRIIPAVFFSEIDAVFFENINYFYQGITIVCYILFLNGIFCSDK